MKMPILTQVKSQYNFFQRYIFNLHLNFNIEWCVMLLWFVIVLIKDGKCQTIP